MKKTLSSLAVMSIILTGCSLTKAPEESIPATDTPPVVAQTDTPETAPTDTSREAPGEQKNLAPTDTPQAIVPGGIYLPYTPTALAQAQDDIILFFHANWSPVCNTLNKDISEKIAEIPTSLTILKVNFDDAAELKTLYGVTEPYTFVQVTNTGELIKKWRGGDTLADIFQQVQK